MSRKVLSVLLLSVLVASLALAGGNRQQAKKVIAPANELEMTYKVPEVVPNPPGPSPSFTPAQGDTIGKTDYDYGWNSANRNMIDTYFPGQPAGSRAQITYMQRNTTLSGNAARRAQSYVFYNGTSYIGPVAAVSRDVAQTGFGDISVFRSTQADGIAAIPSHTAPRLSINAGPGDTTWTVSAIPQPPSYGAGPGDPVSAIRGRSDTLFVVTTGAARDDQWVFRTTDYGVSWRFMDSLKRHIPGTTAWGIGLDPPVQALGNGTLYVFDAPTGTGAVPPLGTSGTADADRLGYWRSTNGGVNWTWTTVALDGQNVLTSKPREYYLFENFGQLDACVDAQGTAHIVTNGYGFDYGRVDSAEVFRVLYWNSSSNTWKFLDRDTLNRPPYVTAALRSGNGIGRPYPTISYDPASRSLVAAWSEPQVTTAASDTANGVYMYDIWYSYSNDGGSTWSTAANLTNTANRTELFAALAREVTQPTAAQRRGHLAYLSESRVNNGSFVIGPVGPRSDSPWMYQYITWTGAAVGDREGLPESYALEQNYPNPFNPSTRISFAVPTTSQVSLTVYDVLGRQVASLVNDVKAAGQHDVLFNAANLASGVYYYTLRAGSFAETKKMVLMK